MRQLVLLRHGRTPWNLAHRVQGHLEAELDEVGHAQAVRAAAVLARLKPVALWSSDLLRARQTASYLSMESGVEPRFDARLREFHLGERQGLTHDEYAERFSEEYAAFRRGNFDVVPGGEKAAQVTARMAAALRDLLSAVGPGETAIAVSHGAAIRQTVPVLLGWPVETSTTSLHGLDNCGWAILDQADSGDPLRLTAYNRVAEPETAPDFASEDESG